MEMKDKTEHIHIYMCVCVCVYSSLQCNMILQKSFWFASQETFLIIINDETFLLLSIIKLFCIIIIDRHKVKRKNKSFYFIYLVI